MKTTHSADAILTSQPIGQRKAVLLGALVSACAIAFTPVSQAAAMFTGIYVFGDSLFDSGYVSLATSGARPGPDYYQGQYSNDPVRWRMATASSMSGTPYHVSPRAA